MFAAWWYHTYNAIVYQYYHHLCLYCVLILGRLWFFVKLKNLLLLGIRVCSRHQKEAKSKSVWEKEIISNVLAIT